jgi:hypothetical protein
MLDTVILSVPEMYYRITKPELFRPHANGLFRLGVAGNNFKNNFHTKDKYFPRLTITPRIKTGQKGLIRNLKIEFSVAKLMFGNNLEEISVFHSEYVYQNLLEKLEEMGIKVFCSPEEFDVSGFDIGKNIFLNKGSFCYHVINELNKCSLDRRFDLDNKEYREGSGTTLQYYSNSHSLVFYDKVADLRKPDKRSTDKDNNHLQKDLFDEYDKQEILRFEVRLRKKVKMKSVLKEIGYNVKSITFGQLFNERLWKLILNHYWKGMVSNENKFIFSKINNDDMLTNKILQIKPNINPRKLYMILNLNQQIKLKGVNQVRKEYTTKLNGTQWSKLKADFEILNEAVDPIDCYAWYNQIDNILSIDKKLL